MSTGEVIRSKFPSTWYSWPATSSLLRQVTGGLFTQEIELEVGGKCWKEYGKMQFEQEDSRQEKNAWICWKIYQPKPGADNLADVRNRHQKPAEQLRTGGENLFWAKQAAVVLEEPDKG